MKTTAIVFTVTNYIFSGILWFLGFLTLIFNILGLWGPWHLAGFGFYFYIPLPILPVILAIVFSCISKSKILIILNFASLLFSMISVVFTLFISAGWFW